MMLMMHLLLLHASGISHLTRNIEFDIVALLIEKTKKLSVGDDLGFSSLKSTYSCTNVNTRMRKVGETITLSDYLGSKKLKKVRLTKICIRKIFELVKREVSVNTEVVAPQSNDEAIQSMRLSYDESDQNDASDYESDQEAITSEMVVATSRIYN